MKSERMIFAQKLANVFLMDSKVRVREGKSNIAYCNVNEKKIWFNFEEIFPEGLTDDEMFERMMVFKGLTFHEIMHLKFTPKSKRLKHMDSNLYQFLGYLEDGRIETLGVMMHEKLADFFISAVNNVLMKDKTAIIRNEDNWLIYAYILCYGRSIYFQDKKIMKTMRELIIKTYGRETADKIEDTIDKYIPEKKFDARIELGKELYEFLRLNKSAPNPTDTQGVWGIDSRDESGSSKDIDQKELEQVFDKLIEALAKNSKQLKDDTKNVKDGKAKRKRFLDSQDKKISKIQDKIKDIRLKSDKSRKILSDKIYEEPNRDKRQKLRQKNSDLINKTEEKIKKKQEQMSEESGKGYSLEDSDTSKTLAELIDEKKQEQEKLVENNKTELTDDLKSIGHNVYVDSDTTFNITDEMTRVAKSMEKGLSRMNNELARGYQPKNRSGRLNMRALLNRKNQLDIKVFNKYTPDKFRQTKVLVNIFLDGSGSMRDNWESAVNTCWIINEALNKDNNKVMAYEFSTNFAIMKEYDRPMTIPRFLGGGTSPSRAIDDAMPKIEKYRKANNYQFVVDVIITDGNFDTGQDKQIERLNALGHETIHIHVGSYNYHKAKHNIILKSFDELASSMIGVFVNIKKGLIAKAKVN